MCERTASCFRCKFLTTWNYPATREDPPESGWECNHPELKDSSDHAWDCLNNDTPEGVCENEGVAEYYAARCGKYEYNTALDYPCDGLPDDFEIEGSYTVLTQEQFDRIHGFEDEFPSIKVIVE